MPAHKHAELIAKYSEIYKTIPRSTMTIGIKEVPKPVRKKLDYGRIYFIPSLVGTFGFIKETWTDSYDDIKRMKSGLVHTDYSNAVAHTEAILELYNRD